jgi:hypothetical protein
LEICPFLVSIDANVVRLAKKTPGERARALRVDGGYAAAVNWHRDKDYGNWNKNEPAFKIRVFNCMVPKLHPHRLNTSNA